MQEREHKSIGTLTLSLGCHGVFSPFSFFVNISFNISLNDESRLHFSFSILKNERLSFFAQLGGHKETQLLTIFFTKIIKRRLPS